MSRNVNEYNEQIIRRKKTNINRITKHNKHTNTNRSIIRTSVHCECARVTDRERRVGAHARAKERNTKMTLLRTYHHLPGLFTFVPRPQADIFLFSHAFPCRDSILTRTSTFRATKQTTTKLISIHLLDDNDSYQQT